MSLFFILGNPRSGTSLFRLMLNSHPEIVVPPECGFALWLKDKYKKIDSQSYQSFAHDVVNCKKFETWGVIEADIISEAEKLKPLKYEELVKCVYSAYAKLRSKSAILSGDKNNYYISHIDSIKSTFPSAKVIFIIRDGRDVACSYLEIKNKSINSKYKPILPTDIESIAYEWKDNAKILIENQDDYFYIRYEDLIGAPERTLLKVCSYLGIEYSSDMLLYNKFNDEPEDFMQWKSKTKEKIDPNNKNKFKTILSKKEIDAFNFICSNELSFFNYL